jgi:hypothetical protein
MLTQDQQDSPPKAAVTARAKGAAVHLGFASNHLTLWLLPTVISITPDDAMALSIELQKAAIDARVSKSNEVHSIVERNWRHPVSKLSSAEKQRDSGVVEAYELPEPDSLGG